VYDGNIAAAPFFRNPQAYHYQNTWADTRANALYPKTSQQDGINRYNYTVSDAPYRLRNAGYMRLKNLQFGYNLPQSLLNKIKFKTAQVYVSGTDMAVFSSLPSGFDPEKPYSIVSIPYPISYTLGVNLSF
ncbi:MAG: hypothetical protein ORN54_14970, partial [Cyclobacteriaceae bacterium]|nr:hypothetical protein [Cyclobacteriaceae bacterium]